MCVCVFQASVKVVEFFINHPCLLLTEQPPPLTFVDHNMNSPISCKQLRVSIGLLSRTKRGVAGRLQQPDIATA